MNHKITYALKITKETWLPTKNKTWNFCLIAILYISMPYYAYSGQIYQTQAVEKPNIVLFISDDHSFEDAGFTGNQDLNTPVLDQLASEGMRFTNAFAAVSVCAPSRSVIYSGLYPHRNGSHQNHSAARKDIQTLPHYLSKLGYEVVLAGKIHVKPESAFPFQYIERHEVPQYLAQVGDKPFCLVICYNAPHEPFFNMKGGHTARNIHPKPWLPQTPETLQYTAAYYDHVEMLDHELGAHLYWLEKYGFADDAIQIYTSDHGAAFPFGKWTLYDQGIHIPLLVKWPGTVKPGSASDAMVSLVDLLPTLVEMAGGIAPENMDGVSLLDLLTRKKTSHHEEIFAAYTNVGVHGANAYPIRAVRSEKYKLIVNLEHENTFYTEATSEADDRSVNDDFKVIQSWIKMGNQDGFAAKRVAQYVKRPYIELYDIENDPYELDNIANNPKNQPVVEKMYASLKTWMKEQNDLMTGEMKPEGISATGNE